MREAIRRGGGVSKKQMRLEAFELHEEESPVAFHAIHARIRHVVDVEPSVASGDGEHRARVSDQRTRRGCGYRCAAVFPLNAEVTRGGTLERYALSTTRAKRASSTDTRSNEVRQVS